MTQADHVRAGAPEPRRREVDVVCIAQLRLEDADADLGPDHRAPTTGLLVSDELKSHGNTAGGIGSRFPADQRWAIDPQLRANMTADAERVMHRAIDVSPEAELRETEAALLIGGEQGELIALPVAGPMRERIRGLSHAGKGGQSRDQQHRAHRWSR